MKRILLTLLALVLATGSASRSLAQNNPAAPVKKPVAVLAIAGWEQLLGDVGMVGRLVGNPDLDKNIEEALKLFTQGQGLAGLDRKRPWGVTLTTDGLNFEPLIFLPVTNQKQLTDALAPLVGDPLDVGKGIAELNIAGQKIYLKSQNGWSFIGQSPDTLTSVPQDPTQFLGGLEKSYGIALRFYVQNVPEVYRSLAVDQLRLGVQSGLTKTPDETQEEFETRRKSVEQQLGAITTSITEVDHITLGLQFDTNAKSAIIDFSTAAVPGSKAAQQLAAAQSTTSDFAGFLVPGSALSLNTSQKIAKEDVASLVENLQMVKNQVLDQVKGQLPPEAAAKLDTQIVTEIFDAIRKTVESGKLDLAANVMLGEKKMSMIFGAYVSDPKNLEEALKKMAATTPADPKFSGFQFDAEQHQGVRFHTASIVVPREEELSKVVGDKLDLAVGVGPKSVYLAIGTDCVNQTKQLIDKSKLEATTNVPPMQMFVSMTPILQFMSTLQADPQLMALTAELTAAQGKDKISITSIPQPPNAATVRIEIQESALRLLTGFGRMAVGMGDPLAAPGF